jgi:hypothetical protein
MSNLSWMNLLGSHVIDSKMQVNLTNENFTRFLELREDCLLKLTNVFLGSMVETSFEDTPPLSSLIIEEDDEEEFDEEVLANGRD